MLNKNQRNAEVAAARIPVEYILSHLGKWSAKSEDKGEFTATYWTGQIGNEKVTLLTTSENSTGKEDSNVLFLEGGRPSLPFTKLDFICSALFEGDMAKAIAFSSSFKAGSENWLIEMGRTARKEDPELPVAQDFSFDYLVDEQLTKLKALEAAKAKLAEEKYMRHNDLPQAKNLNEWLSEPDEDITYRIEELWPSGGTVFLVAPYKAGKTTAVKNVTRCLCDGGLFLGRFTTQPVDGSVGYLNFELNPNQSKQWLKRLNIKNPEKLWTWNLKGYSNPLQTDLSRLKFAQDLTEKSIDVLIVDPFSGAYRKGDSKDNDLVKQFLVEIDEMARKAGVKEILVAVHAGYDQTHARGASTLGDHPDATWNITKDTFNNKRFFKAEGRDVLVDEEELVIEKDGITLRLNGMSKAEASMDLIKSLIIEVVRMNPDCMAGDVDSKVPGNNSKKIAARKALVSDGVLVESTLGNAKTYRLA